VRDGRRRARVSRGPCEHRWSRGKEGTQSGRISCVRNVETPSWSAGRRSQPPGGRPIARGAEYQAGKDGREANAGGRKAAGNQASMLPPPRAAAWITGRIPALAGPERELTRAR